MRRMAIRSRYYPLNSMRCLSELLRGIRRNFFRLSPCYGQVPYVLLTRAPVAGGSIATSPLPLDLHVLSLSLAFILSQDQTLRCCLYIFLFFFIKKSKAKIQTVCSVISFAFTETTVKNRMSARSVSGCPFNLLRSNFEIDRVHFLKMTLVLLSCLL